MDKKPGRKLLEIKAKDVEALASYGCTNSEIASFFGCDRTTITKRFSRIVAKGRDAGKIRLRKKQFEVAVAGNVSMLIWLGKQVLGQTDKQGIELSGQNILKIEYVPVKKEKNDKATI